MSYLREALAPSTPSTYAWIITHVNVNDLGEDCADEKGTMGPRRATPEMQARLQAGEGHTFRLLDDDGIWYYRGRIIFSVDGGPAQVKSFNGRYADWVVCGGLQKDDDADGNDEFGPLDDFGTPNAGATEIQYRAKVQDPEGDEGDMIAVWATI